MGDSHSRGNKKRLLGWQKYPEAECDTEIQTRVLGDCITVSSKTMFALISSDRKCCLCSSRCGKNFDVHSCLGELNYITSRTGDGAGRGWEKGGRRADMTAFASGFLKCLLPQTSVLHGAPRLSRCHFADLTQQLGNIRSQYLPLFTHLVLPLHQERSSPLSRVLARTMSL